MALTSRSRANSEVDGKKQRDWIHQVFSSYTIPLDLGKDVIDTITGHTIRLQSRYLGTASLTSRSLYYPHALFYEITESEISEIPFSEKRLTNGSVSSSGDEVMDYSTDSKWSQISSPPPILLDSEKSPMALPPKKRKRRRVTRYEVIFCLDPEPHHDMFNRPFFLFPEESIIESLNETPPLETLVSFHLPKGSDHSILHSVCSCQPTIYSTKLEELATVCTKVPLRQKRRFTDPGLPLFSKIRSDCHVMNIRLSGVSNDLFIALKQHVSDFENRYRKMMELMKLHSQQISTQKLDFAIDNVDEEDLKFTNMIAKNYMTQDWSSEDEEHDDQDDEDYVESGIVKTEEDAVLAPNLNKPDKSSSSSSSNSNRTNHVTSTGYVKKCLYCGSKSTPMWRRGPQGAGTLCNACGVKWKHGKILCGENKKVIEEPQKKKKRKSTCKKPQKKTQEEEIGFNHQRRHTTDMSMVDRFGYNAYALTPAGVDAVEAAAVLTLLKRS